MEEVEEYKTVLDNARDGILAIDAATRKILFANKSVCKLTGYFKQELLNLTVEKIHPKKNLPLVLSQLKKMCEGKIKFAKYVPVLRKDKKTIYCDVSCSLVDARKRKIVFEFLRDATEYKKEEELLKESEKKFRNLFDNAVDPIVILDNKAKIIDVNKKVEEKVGYKRSELIGKKFTELNVLTMKSKLITFKNFLKRMAGFEVPPYEIEVIKKNGEILIGEINAAPIKIDSKIKGDMVIIRDITERKKAEELLKKSYEELKRLDVEKDKFISIAAHELKTPLAAIHGFSQLLQNESVFVNTETRNKFLKIIDEETKRLAKLVNDVLDLSRIDLGTFKLDLKNTNLYETIKDVKEEMEESIRQAGLESEWVVAENLPHIVTDKERLKQILLNLISNAIKYTPKGKITVKVKKEKDSIHFSVKDTGIGIAKKNQANLFQRFYQIESPYTRKVKGAGLGLSICKELVELMGGKIWLNSKVGKGTTFHFILPINFKSKKQ